MILNRRTITFFVIGRIATQHAAHFGKMNPDLMGSPSFQAAFDQAKYTAIAQREFFEGANVRYRSFSFVTFLS